MSECKACMTLVLGIMLSMKNGNVDEAINNTEVLLSLFKSYKTHC